MMGDCSCDDIKKEIYDSKSGITYKRGDFLGKGGFARCYKFKNIATEEVFAGKVISRSTFFTLYSKEKVDREICIQSAMSHQSIVSLHSHFEDESNLYIILELCHKKSLMEMCKRRKTLTLPEVRYFLRQVVLACVYMHENKVIHRDLKLDNLFINDNMEIKVGDFGLATFLSHDGIKKTSLCGTTNYMAPEMLLKKGYGFEVDIWSLGCIMYALLVGSLPFDATFKKQTFEKIKNNEYYLPQSLESSAKYLIQRLLHPNPKFRPDAAAILKDNFFENQFIPNSIPVSCLFKPPRFNKNITLLRDSKVSATEIFPKKKRSQGRCNKYGKNPTKITVEAVIASNLPLDVLMQNLLDMLDCVVKCPLEDIYSGNPEDAQDPSAVPFFWISKWIDATDKYGMGYQLCDNTIGVIFKDKTHMLLLADGKTLQYIMKSKEHLYYTTNNYPVDLNKKFTYLTFFKKYMHENLAAEGGNTKSRERDKMAQAPHLFAWLKKKTVIVFHLTNGTFQVNFSEDHTKLILCPVMGAVSYIDEGKNFTVYTFKLIEKYGCPRYLASKLRCARELLEDLKNNLKN